MSIEATSWAWRNSSGATVDVFAFLCLIECSGGGSPHSGVTAGYQQVADLARLDLTSTRRALDNLVRLGELEIEEHRDGLIVWTIPALRDVDRSPAASTHHPTSPTGVVYIIGSESHHLVKIGHSTNVAARLRSIQNMSPAPLSVLWTTPGGRALESQLHDIFSGLRAHGEWFDFGTSDPVAMVTAEVTR